MNTGVTIIEGAEILETLPAIVEFVAATPTQGGSCFWSLDTAKPFRISGGGFGSVALTPALPVPVSLDMGEIRTITFSTDWEEGPDSDYTISWGFEVLGVTLMDPVMPDTVAGSWSGNVEGGGGGDGGCSIYKKDAAIYPYWRLFLVLSGFRLIRNRIQSLKNARILKIVACPYILLQHHCGDRINAHTACF